MCACIFYRKFKNSSIKRLISNTKVLLNIIYTLNLQIFIFQLETIDGEILQVIRDDSGLKIQSDTSEVNIKLGDIETEFGLIHIIDSVLI